jgi:hypothetical protein
VADPLPKRVRETIEQPSENWTDDQAAEAFTYWRSTVPQWRGVNDQIEAQWRRHPLGTTQLELAKRDVPRETHVLERGDFLKPAALVTPGVLSALQPFPPEAPATRLGLAQWLTERNSPTTARSIVNRIWQAYFGLGIVETSEDFGTQGSLPSHPELLDWLAVELMDHNWSLKQLHRLIVNSATYRHGVLRE